MREREWKWSGWWPSFFIIIISAVSSHAIPSPSTDRQKNIHSWKEGEEAKEQMISWLTHLPSTDGHILLLLLELVTSLYTFRHFWWCSCWTFCSFSALLIIIHPIAWALFITALEALSLSPQNIFGTPVLTLWYDIKRTVKTKRVGQSTSLEKVKRTWSEKMRRSFDSKRNRDSDDRNDTYNGPSNELKFEKATYISLPPLDSKLSMGEREEIYSHPSFLFEWSVHSLTIHLVYIHCVE